MQAEHHDKCCSGNNASQTNTMPHVSTNKSTDSREREGTHRTPASFRGHFNGEQKAVVATMKSQGLQKVDVLNCGGGGGMNTTMQGRES